MLKKEFRKKDVNRARNLIMGKTGESTGTQIGYKKKQTEYKEIFTPLCCPECSKVMKHNLDIDSYRIHKNCHDCVIKFEHKLKITGKYDEYISKLKARNNLSILDEVESYLLTEVNKSNDGYVSEDGVVERWVGGVDKVKFTKEIKKAAKVRRERLNKELNDKKGA